MNARVGIKHVPPKHRIFWEMRPGNSEAMRQLQGIIHGMPWNGALMQLPNAKIATYHTIYDSDL